MFELSKLKFDYDALEPYIDALTVETHYSKHHQNYCNNLNKALDNYPQFTGVTIEDILKNTENIPEEVRQLVINNGGGYFNHNLYWENMGTQFKSVPEGKLAEALNNAFSSFADFQKLFSDSGIKLFGSGWTWLVKNRAGALKIVNTVNQDSPISSGLQPILALDVWEHAYYLKYQNRRAEYIQNWWNVVNWKVVADRLAAPLP